MIGKGYWQPSSAASCLPGYAIHEFSEFMVHPFSVEKGSKHMNVRCFFVVDKLEKKEVKIVHCPSDKMVADFSSKPLQGSLFRHHRNAMRGIVDNDFVLQK